MSNQYTYKALFTAVRLRSDYAAGMTQVEIAANYGTTQKVVWRAMRNMGMACRRAAKRDQRGKNNANWKGADAGYAALHKRVEKLRGRPSKCEVCGTDAETKFYDWANLTGRYDDPGDYKRMCRSCHWKHDKKILNIRRMRERCRNG